VKSIAAYSILRAVGAVCVAALAAGCSEPIEVCTPILLPALTITVRDSVTGVPTASGVTASGTRHGDTTETVVVPNDPSKDASPIPLGTDAGTYDIVLTKAGYVDWRRTDIVVAANGCHPQTRSIEALLQKR